MQGRDDRSSPSPPAPIESLSVAVGDALPHDTMQENPTQTPPDSFSSYITTLSPSRDPLDNPDPSNKDHMDPRQAAYATERDFFTYVQFNIMAAQSTTMAAETALLTGNAIDPEGNISDINSEVREIAAGCGLILGIFVYGWYFWKTRIAPFLRRKGPEAQPAQAKNMLIEWIDRYDSANSLGTNIGQFIASLIPMPSPVFTELLKTGLGAAIGFITGVAAAAFIEDTADAPAERQTIFKVGKDSWPTYSKMGMVIGGLIGSLVMGLIGLFLPIPGGLLLGLALGATGGSILGYVTTLGIVPLVNKIKNHLEKKEGAKNQEDDIDKDKALSQYRSNYIRAGASLGAAFGGIFGFILGFVPPFTVIPFSCLLLGTIFSSLFGLIGAAALGAAGPAISARVDPHNTNIDKWDYGIRGGAFAGTEAGKLTANVYKAIQPDVCSDAESAAINSGILLGSAIGVAHDLYRGGENKHRLLSWSKHIWIFGSLGGGIGGLIGLCLPVPGGMLLGMAIGASTGWLIGGALGVAFGDRIFKKWPQFTQRVTEKLAKWMAKKTDAEVQPDLDLNNDVPLSTYASTLKDMVNITTAEEQKSALVVTPCVLAPQRITQPPATISYNNNITLYSAKKTTTPVSTPLALDTTIEPLF